MIQYFRVNQYATGGTPERFLVIRKDSTKTTGEIVCSTALSELADEVVEALS